MINTASSIQGVYKGKGETRLLNNRGLDQQKNDRLLPFPILGDLEMVEGCDYSPCDKKAEYVVYDNDLPYRGFKPSCHEHLINVVDLAMGFNEGNSQEQDYIIIVKLREIK